MPHPVRITLTTLLLLFPAGVRAQTPAAIPCPPASTVASPESLRFQALYKAEWAWRRAQNGSTGDEDGPPHVEAHLPHEDAATQAERLAYWTGVLAKLDGLNVAALSPGDRINFAVYRAQIVTLLNAQRFREYEKPANSDTAFWSEIESEADEPFRTEADYLSFLSQMAELPRFFAEETAEMRAGLLRGFTPPRVTLEGRDAALVSVASAPNPEATGYYKPFLTMPVSIPAARQAELRAQAAAVIRSAVIPAYASLLHFWRDEYVPHAVVSLAAESQPNGKAYYQSKILEFTTVTLTPEQIHAIGLSEMASIRAEMLGAMQASGFKGDFPAFLHFLRTDPQFYAKTPEELLMRAAWIAKEFDGVSGKYFGYLPRQRFAIRPVPAAIAPFYTSARGGPTVYLVNTFDLPSRGLYSLPALTLHESAPGHSMQGSISEEHKDVPRFRNEYISAYGEGWALYCERLGTEMGLYHTPYETFGMLSYQAWRAARLVVDTGVHSEGWTREQALAYLRDNTALSDHEIATEVDRYISWPGQALSYYLGEMDILKERHKAEAALGAKFNLRAFHDAVLAVGSVPLPVLDEHMDAWIAGGGVGPYPEMER